MEIKFESSLHGLSLKSNGEYRVEVNVPLVDISKAMSIVRLLNKKFTVEFEVEGISSKIDASFNRLIIDKDGESRIMFLTDNIQMNGKASQVLGNSIEKNIKIIIVGE